MYKTFLDDPVFNDASSEIQLLWKIMNAAALLFLRMYTEHLYLLASQRLHFQDEFG